MDRPGNPRGWNSPTAHALMARAATDDPVMAARQAATKLLQDAEIRQPPVDLDLLGSFCGILQVQLVDMDCAGMLLPANEGYVVQLKATDSQGRRRFTHAHEIGHLLVEETHLGPEARRDTTTGEYGRDSEVEYLCDVAASELLMPLGLFHEALGSRRPALQDLLRLARTFDVSMEAAALRLTEAPQSDCGVIVWEPMLKKSQVKELDTQTAFPGMEDFAPQPRLRIRTAKTSDALRKHYFPPEKSIAEDCLVCQCLQTDSAVCGRADLPTGNGPVVFWTESIAAPYTRERDKQTRIITLVFPIEPRVG